MSLSASCFFLRIFLDMLGTEERCHLVGNAQAGNRLVVIATSVEDGYSEDFGVGVVFIRALISVSSLYYRDRCIIRTEQNIT